MSLNHASVNRTARLMERLRSEFADRAEESFEEISEFLEAMRSGQDADTESLLGLMRKIHNIKGQAGTLGYPSVSVVAHRLEDYIEELEEQVGKHVGEIYHYLDTMRGMLQSSQDMSEQECQEVLRALPSAGGDTVRDAPLHDAVVVSSSNLIRGIARAISQANGLRVTSTSSSLEGYILAVRTRPDVVVANLVMDEVDGADLANALSVTRATRDIPMVLVSSSSADNQRDMRLPATTELVKYDKEIAPNLELALKRAIGA